MVISSFLGELNPRIGTGKTSARGMDIQTGIKNRVYERQDWIYVWNGFFLGGLGPEVGAHLGGYWRCLIEPHQSEMSGV
jgi:hypothetical protein